MTILTYWALVCIAKVNRAVGRIWRAANVKVISTSKYWTVATVAKDGFSFLTIYQRHLCWWQATGIDKAEQERTWCSFVQSSIWQKNIYWVRLVVLQFSIANRDKTRTKTGLTMWVKKNDNIRLKTIQQASLPYDKSRSQTKKNNNNKIKTKQKQTPTIKTVMHFSRH